MLVNTNNKHEKTQDLLSFKLCGPVRLFEDLLHISWKRVNACYSTFFKMKNSKEIISGILNEKVICTPVHIHTKVFGVLVTTWTACFMKSYKLTIEFWIVDVP